MTELTTTVHDSITECKQGEWNAVVAQQSRTGSAFERYEYLRAYEEATGAPARHVQVRNSGTLIGVHPAFVRSLPGTPFRFLGPPKPGFNGLLVATDEAEVVAAILDRLRSLTGGRTVGHIVKPASSRGLRYATRLRDRGYAQSVRDCRFTVDVNRPWEAIESDLTQKKRRNLRQADERGVTVATLPVTDDSIRTFAELHAAHMSRIDGDGTDHDFLEALRTNAADRLVLFEATAEDEPAGQLLAVRDEECDRLFLLFPAYDPENFRSFPSEVLYRGAIRWAIESGYRLCDYGETTPDFADGTFAFKSGLGGRPEASLRWERLDSRLLRAFYALGGDRVLDRLPGVQASRSASPAASVTEGS